MAYEKVKARFEIGVDENDELIFEIRDYIQNRTKRAIYQAPDTPAGKASLDKRRKA